MVFVHHHGDCSVAQRKSHGFYAHACIPVQCTLIKQQNDWEALQFRIHDHE
jgi:hypothetical protein